MACDVSQSMTFHLRSCKTHMYSVSPPKNSMFGKPAPAKSDEFVYFFQTRGGGAVLHAVYFWEHFSEKKCQIIFKKGPGAGDQSLFWKSQKFIPFCGRGLPLYINYKHNIWSRLSRCTDINVNGKHPTQTCTHVKLPLSFPSCCVLTRLHKNPNCRAFGICGRH